MEREVYHLEGDVVGDVVADPWDFFLLPQYN
jgi:hypothetical protein